LRALGRETPAFLAGVAYAASDELHQHFVAGRHSSPIDLAIDTAGIALGLLAWLRVRA
jgi:VanZ family protein